jgi:hypothetical protein
MPAYHAEIRKYCAERYPGLTWLFIMQDQGPEPCRKELEKISKNFEEDTPGMELIASIRDILTIANC